MTTISVKRETTEKLNKLKIHRRESYEEVILRLIEEREKRGSK